MKQYVSISSTFINVVVFVARMKGDTPVNSTMSVGQARKLVEQLKIEASFCRIKVRQAHNPQVHMEIMIPPRTYDTEQQLKLYTYILHLNFNFQKSWNNPVVQDTFDKHPHWFADVKKHWWPPQISQCLPLESFQMVLFSIMFLMASNTPCRGTLTLLKEQLTSGRKKNPTEDKLVNDIIFLETLFCHWHQIDWLAG